MDAIKQSLGIQYEVVPEFYSKIIFCTHMDEITFDNTIILYAVLFFVICAHGMTKLNQKLLQELQNLSHHHHHFILYKKADKRNL